MSIRSLFFAAPLLLPIPASAQSIGSSEAEKPTPSEVAEQLIARSKEVLSVEAPPPERPADCVESQTDADGGTVIIVCAPIEDDPASFRGRSRLERGDDSHLSWDGSAPYVGGEGIFTGPATVSGLCVVPPCPPPPVYYIDVGALPEAPPGSDADRIARGLPPRGSRYDEGEAVVIASEADTGDGTTESDPPER